MPRTSSLPLAKYSLQTLETKGPYNLSDALASIPGISQMSTGNAISKPVIRGLYGNRILVLLSGLRFDNQQFYKDAGIEIHEPVTSPGHRGLRGSAPQQSVHPATEASSLNAPAFR
ncbi:MAG: Plug domain-containing protein [Verrucomicrobia bacterium]|nr:Plug domain-containing protein [Verrucomicrobiota bacterium]NDE98766.1 Plug domain-containing protein [Verrucomicrobiota bacterium]